MRTELSSMPHDEHHEASLEQFAQSSKRADRSCSRKYAPPDTCAELLLKRTLVKATLSAEAVCKGKAARKNWCAHHDFERKGEGSSVSVKTSVSLLLTRTPHN